MRGNEHKLGFVLAFGAMLFGGTYSPLAKALSPYLSPIPLLLLSESLTALFIVATLGLLRLVNSIASMRGRELFFAVVVGVLNSGLAPYLWFKGLTMTTAVNASLLYGSDVLFTLAFSAILLSERINRLQGIGAFIVLVGVGIVNLAPNLTGGGGGIAAHVGDLYVLAGIAVFSLGAVLFKKYLSHTSAEVSLFVRNIAGMVAVLTVSGFVGSTLTTEIANFPADKIVLLLGFVFFARYLHLTFFYEALNRLPASELGLIENAMPLSGVLFSVLLLHEQVFMYQLLGAILIVFGLFLEQTSSDTWRRTRQAMKAEELMQMER